jgi:hypothetical protein
MKSVNSKLITVAISLLIPQLTWGHARLKSTGLLIPRSTNAGIKTGPCGNLPRSASAVTLTAGSVIQIEWEETIQHPGRYEFSISPANDANFTRLLVVPDTQDNPANLPHQYKANFTVPNIVCDKCTFQMIQVMTENPAAPTNYYSCADIKIVAGATPPTEMPPALPEPEVPSLPDPVGNDAPQTDCHSSTTSK